MIGNLAIFAIVYSNLIGQFLEGFDSLASTVDREYDPIMSNSSEMDKLIRLMATVKQVLLFVMM